MNHNYLCITSQFERTNFLAKSGATYNERNDGL